MNGSERQRVMKRAAQIRKASRAKVGGPKRVRVLDPLEDEDDLPIRKSERTASMDEYVWRVLQEDDAQPEVYVPEGALSGTVITVGPRTCQVVLDGRTVECTLSADLASSQQTDLAVGDEAILEKRGGSYIVHGAKPRRTKLSRPDPGKASLERVVVANVDRVVVVVSVVSPPLHPRLIDRYLIAIQRGGAQMALAVNKLDLLEDPSEELAKLRPYEALGVPVVRCSAARGEGREELRELLKGSLSAFVGHSGVGKSSLLNSLKPELALDTGSVSESYGRGTHTTTASTLWDLGEGTRVIDTPGIRSFGLWNIREEDVPWYFPEFALAGKCKFSDCTHTHEPNCAVKEAIEREEISEDRYDTYLRIRRSLG